MKTATLKVSLTSNEGENITELDCNHIDIVSSHSVFYSAKQSAKHFRIFDSLQSIAIGNKKITLFYSNYYAEIIKT